MQDSMFVLDAREKIAHKGVASKAAGGSIEVRQSKSARSGTGKLYKRKVIIIAREAIHSVKYNSSQ